MQTVLDLFVQYRSIIGIGLGLVVILLIGDYLINRHFNRKSFADLDKPIHKKPCVHKWVLRPHAVFASDNATYTLNAGVRACAKCPEVEKRLFKPDPYEPADSRLLIPDTRAGDWLPEKEFEVLMSTLYPDRFAWREKQDLSRSDAITNPTEPDVNQVQLPIDSSNTIVDNKFIPDGGGHVIHLASEKDADDAA